MSSIFDNVRFLNESDNDIIKRKILQIENKYNIQIPESYRNALLLYNDGKVKLKKY